MGVRCLHKRAEGRQKGHESKNLGSHLLGTHLLSQAERRVMAQHETPPWFLFAVCHECTQHQAVKFGESLRGVTRAGRSKEVRNSLNFRASN